MNSEMISDSEVGEIAKPEKKQQFKLDPYTARSIKRQEARYRKVAKFFNAKDEKFLKACESVNLKPTKRQASKWLNRKGLAWNKVGRFSK